MPLLENGQIVDDTWQTLTEEAPSPTNDSVAVIVPFARYLTERDIWAAHEGPLGLAVKAGEDVEELTAEDLSRISLIALDFPKFNDGRAFSSARILRERLGFTGRIRATGEVLRDQLLFMQRCGFDSYLIPRADAEQAWAAALKELSVWYQPTADGRPWITALRTGRWERQEQAAE